MLLMMVMEFRTIPRGTRYSKGERRRIAWPHNYAAPRSPMNLKYLGNRLENKHQCLLNLVQREDETLEVSFSVGNSIPFHAVSSGKV